MDECNVHTVRRLNLIYLLYFQAVHVKWMPTIIYFFVRIFVVVSGRDFKNFMTRHSWTIWRWAEMTCGSTLMHLFNRATAGMDSDGGRADRRRMDRLGVGLEGEKEG